MTMLPCAHHARSATAAAVALFIVAYVAPTAAIASPTPRDAVWPPAPPPPAPPLPTLQYTQRSDWLNVKDGCNTGPKAFGDGTHDDTAALQACLTNISNTGNTTVFLPAGTYKITKTIKATQVLGGLIVGTGQTTRLVWAGSKGGIMFWSDGMSRSRVIGMVFDGAHLAGVGIDHNSHPPGLFETRVRHTNLAFVNIPGSGIRIGFDQTKPKLESSEILYENCIFDSVGTPGVEGTGGITALWFNDYDNAVDGCLFRNCSYGVYLDKMANAYVRNTRFEGSTDADMRTTSSCGASLRRCVSVGSKALLVSTSAPFVSPTTVQDCRVDGWTGDGGAISYSLRGPLLLMDNAFTNTSAGAGFNVTRLPVQTAPPEDGGVNATNQMILLSNNTVDGAPAGAWSLIRNSPSGNVMVRELPPAGPQSYASPITPQTTFLKKTWPVPKTVIDARAMGARGDGRTDDTAAVQATIDKAATTADSIAFFPTGTYLVNETINIKAGTVPYTVGGTGFKSVIKWGNASTVPDPAIVVVQGSRGATAPTLTIEQMDFDGKYNDKGPGPDPGDTYVRLLHTGGSATYDGVYTEANGGQPLWNETGFEVRGLGAGDVVHCVHVDGNLFANSSAAGSVITGFFIQGTLRVANGGKPAPPPRRSRVGSTGAAGASNAVAAPPAVQLPSFGALVAVGLVDSYSVHVQDDSSLVATDFYNEQLKVALMLLEGTTRSGYINGRASGPAGSHLALRDGAVPPPGATPVAGGRVTLSFIKAQSYTGQLLQINGYAGEVTGMMGFMLSSPLPQTITQAAAGAAPVNVTAMGMGFWGNDSSSKTVSWALQKSGREFAVGNLVAYYGPQPTPPGQTVVYPDAGDAVAAAEVVGRALDDLRDLGAADLALNHPGVAGVRV